MKFFFRMVLLAWMLVFCSGCGLREEGGKAGGGGGQEAAGETADGVWQQVDTAMGTVVQQTVYGSGEEVREYFDRAGILLENLEQDQISWRLETSEVFRINQCAGRDEGCRISEDMGRLLQACLQLSRKSEGAFDITLGPLVRLWNIDKWAAGGNGDDFPVPSGDEIRKTLELCGSGRVRLEVRNPEGEASFGEVLEERISEGDSLEGGSFGKALEEGISEGDSLEGGSFGEALEERISEGGSLEGGSFGEALGEGDFSGRGSGQEFRIWLPDGMQLDLGAVGKGVALSRFCDLLKGENGITGAVVSLGGSILTYGEKADGTPWKVGIVDPFDTSSNVGVLTLEGQWFISTSGDYERYVEAGGVRYHHILDPATGYPAECGVRGVTILAGDGLLSDGLSTACFLLGPDRGMTLAGEYGAEVLFVMEDGEIVMSEGMKEYFQER